MRRSRVQVGTVEDEQERECPLCGERKTLRGLHGHLRLKHHKQKEEIMELISQSPLVQGSDAEEIIDLLELLKHLEEQYKRLEALAARGCFHSDDVQEAVLATVRREAREIAARLAVHGVMIEDADMQALCAGASRGEGDEE